MSLTTYSNLKIELIDWSHRDDLDTRIDTFIDIAESKMFSPGRDPMGRQCQPLKLRGMESEETITTSTSVRTVALPTGYQSARKMRIQITNGESVEIFYRTPAQLELISTVGMPRFFTITDVIEFDRISDIAYTGYLQAYIEFTALSSGNTTNVVLTNHPDIYLHGCLAALYEFSGEYDVAQHHWQMFYDAIRGANNKADQGRYGPAPQMRMEGATP